VITGITGQMCVLITAHFNATEVILIWTGATRPHRSIAFKRSVS
jgi:hypothetical protein